jgi:hypothetical protein
MNLRSHSIDKLNHYDRRIDFRHSKELIDLGWERMPPGMGGKIVNPNIACCWASRRMPLHSARREWQRVESGAAAPQQLIHPGAPWSQT